MKIRYNKVKGVREFKGIEPGKIFQLYNNEYYLRLNSYDTAANLETGEIVVFGQYTLVTPVEAELVIE